MAIPGDPMVGSYNMFFENSYDIVEDKGVLAGEDRQYPLILSLCRQFTESPNIKAIISM